MTVPQPDTETLLHEAASIAHRIEIYGSREGRGHEAAEMIRNLAAALAIADEQCRCFGLKRIQMADGSWQDCAFHAALDSLPQKEDA